MRQRCKQNGEPTTVRDTTAQTVAYVTISISSLEDPYADAVSGRCVATVCETHVVFRAKSSAVAVARRDEASRLSGEASASARCVKCGDPRQRFRPCNLMLASVRCPKRIDAFAQCEVRVSRHSNSDSPRKKTPASGRGSPSPHHLRRNAASTSAAGRPSSLVWQTRREIGSAGTAHTLFSPIAVRGQSFRDRPRCHGGRCGQRRRDALTVAGGYREGSRLRTLPAAAASAQLAYARSTSSRLVRGKRKKTRGKATVMEPRRQAQSLH